MSACRRGVVALVAIVIAPLTARAADIPLIRVFPPACETSPVSIDDFVDSLRVELAGRQPHCCVVGPGGDAANDAVKVTLSIEPCDAANPQIEVQVDMTTPPRTIQRQVALADLPAEARPRALALAVAELIRSAAALAGPGEPAGGPPPAQPPPVAPPPPLAEVAGTVTGDLRHHFGSGTTLWGARLGLSVSSGRWRAALDAGAATSDTQVGVGSVTVLLASASLFVGPRFAAGRAVVGFGPTGALGWARVKGQSDMSGVVPAEGSNLVATAGIRATIEAPAPHVVRAFACGEGGLTVRWLDAAVLGQTAAGISGPYLMIALGVRFGPGR
jgi:hypothetical protein